MNKLYFVTRTDLTEGRRAAQLIHAADEWCKKYGYQGGAVIVYGVPSERKLLAQLPEGGRTATFREPDLDNEMTAFATDQGPFKLPLLGGRENRERQAA